MKSLLREEKFIGKEVKKMKRIFALPLLLGLILGLSPSNAMADDSPVVPPAPRVDILDYSQTVVVTRIYDALGAMIGQNSTTTTKTKRKTTTQTVNDNGTPDDPSDDFLNDPVEEITWDTTVQTVHSAYHNGTLKTDSVTVDSTTNPVDANGDADTSTVLKHTKYVDSYSYDEHGHLTDVQGSGTYDSYNPDTKGTTTGTITRTFEIIGGQAALAEQDKNGIIKELNNNGTPDDSSDDKLVQTKTEKIKTTFTNELRDGQIVSTGNTTVAKTYSKGTDTEGKPTDKIDALTSETTIQTTNKYDTYSAGSWRLTSSTEHTTSLTGTDTDGNDELELGSKDSPLDSISSKEETKFVTTYTRDAAGNVIGLTKDMTLGHKMANVNGANVYWQLKDGSYTATVKHDNQFGYYVSQETWTWTPIINPHWGKAWGDPAVTGTVYQGDDGSWYMNVKTWTDAKGTVHNEELTIKIDLLSLLPGQIDDMKAILEEYAESGKDLTIFGLSKDGTLSEEATLEVIGLGKGEFSAHPFDFEGEKPISLEEGQTNYAKFVAMMNGAYYQSNVYGDMSDADKAKTYRELYLTLMNGDLKIGDTFTTSTGVTFKLSAEGNHARLDGKGPGGIGHFSNGYNPMRHFPKILCQELGLVE